MMAEVFVVEDGEVGGVAELFVVGEVDSDERVWGDRRGLSWEGGVGEAGSLYGDVGGSCIMGI